MFYFWCLWRLKCNIYNNSKLLQTLRFLVLNILAQRQDLFHLNIQVTASLSMTAKHTCDFLLAGIWAMMLGYLLAMFSWLRTITRPSSDRWICTHITTCVLTVIAVYAWLLYCSRYYTVVFETCLYLAVCIKSSNLFHAFWFWHQPVVFTMHKWWRSKGFVSDHLWLVFNLL